MCERLPFERAEFQPAFRGGNARYGTAWPAAASVVPPGGQSPAFSGVRTL